MVTCRERERAKLINVLMLPNKLIQQCSNVMTDVTTAVIVVLYVYIYAGTYPYFWHFKNLIHKTIAHSPYRSFSTYTCPADFRSHLVNGAALIMICKYTGQNKIRIISSFLELQSGIGNSRCALNFMIHMTYVDA